MLMKALNPKHANVWIAGVFNFKVYYLMIQSLMAIRNLCVRNFDLGCDRVPS